MMQRRFISTPSLIFHILSISFLLCLIQPVRCVTTFGIDIGRRLVGEKMINDKILNSIVREDNEGDNLQIIKLQSPRDVSSKEICLSILRGGGGNSSSSTPALKNSAILFIKPHANTPEVQKLVTSTLSSLEIDIKQEKTITGKEMNDRQYIDQHYYAIANRATLKKPKDMNVPEDKFESFFGESWGKVLSEKRASNAMDACKLYFDSDSSAIDQAWREAEKLSRVVKFGGGFYCGLLSIPPSSSKIYVFNAFYMSLRSKFVEKDCAIQLYEVEWDPKQLSWEDFRSKVLGVTDPSVAKNGSLRQIIYQRYKKLGLSSKPTKGDNGVHGSASPFEGLAEKVNWLNQPIAKDEFGKALLSKGIPKRVLKHWCTDPRVKLASKKGSIGDFDYEEIDEGSLFDAVEDLDANECLERLVKIHSVK